MSNRATAKVKERIYSSAMGVLNKLKSFPNRPESMAYFEEIIKSSYETGRQNPGKKKVIGTYCMMVPEELVYAAGALPVRLCAGSHEAASLGEAILPPNACPMVKTIVGFTRGQLSPSYESCETVVIPTTCGWKKKLGEILQNYKPVWWLEVPHLKETEASLRHWYEEIAGLKRKLEKLTGNKITRKRLLTSIKTIRQAQGEFRRFYRMRMNKPPLISGQDALLVVQSYFYDDPDSWGDNLRRLNEELEQRRAQQIHVSLPAAPRILLTGSPILFPNWKIPNLIESSGGTIVMDEFCSSSRYVYDLVAVDELSMSELLKAVADR